MEQGTHVVLASGGMDSTVAAHAAVRWGPAELVVYLDTTTGAERNRRYVERLAEHLGVQLWTLRTHKPYDEWVRDWEQFPGSGMHPVAYRRLKEAQIDKLYAIAETPLHLWTGIRAFESDARLASAAPVEDDGRRAERYWHNPIHDWPKERCERYLDQFDLPRNPLWDVLGRSADCFCGCYGSPEELIDAEAAGCPRVVDREENDPAPAVVVNMPDVRADEFELARGGTVASRPSNTDYPGSARVAVVVNQGRLGNKRPDYDGDRAIPMEELIGGAIACDVHPRPRLKVVKGAIPTDRLIRIIEYLRGKGVEVQVTGDHTAHAVHLGDEYTVRDDGTVEGDGAVAGRLSDAVAEVVG